MIKYKQDFKKFLSKEAFYKFVGETYPEFDYKGSCGLVGSCFKTKDGQYHRPPNLFYQLELFNKLFGANFHSKGSSKTRTFYIIVFKEGKERPEKIENPVFDLTHAESLKDAEDAKQELETYGKQFGIDLKKNKSFDNMLKDLVAHIEG